MFKIISILVITALMFSCVGSRKFHNQKYTNLKTTKAPAKSDSEISTTTNITDVNFSEEDNFHENYIPEQIYPQTKADNLSDEDKVTETYTTELVIYNTVYTKHANNTLNDADVIDDYEMTADETKIETEPIDDGTEEEEEDDDKLVTIGIILLCLGIFFPPLIIVGIIL